MHPMLFIIFGIGICCDEKPKQPQASGKSAFGWLRILPEKKKAGPKFRSCRGIDWLYISLLILRLFKCFFFKTRTVIYTSCISYTTHLFCGISNTYFCPRLMKCRAFRGVLTTSASETMAFIHQLHSEAFKPFQCVCLYWSVFRTLFGVYPLYPMFPLIKGREDFPHSLLNTLWVLMNHGSNFLQEQRERLV